METISFSQQELRVIISVFNHVTIKLGDAINMLPIFEKISKHIIKEEAPKAPVDGPFMKSEVPEVK